MGAILGGFQCDPPAPQGSAGPTGHTGRTGHTGPTGPGGGFPSALNKDQAPLATSGNFQTTGITISSTPEGYVGIIVNGVQYVLGNGVRTTDCYFSADGGTTARAIGAIASGDTLYWNGLVIGFDLAITDRVSMNYDS